MGKKKTLISLLSIMLIFTICLFSCSRFTPSPKAKVSNTKKSVEDQKPTLTVSIMPEEPTDYSQITILVIATDDKGLSEKHISFPTLNIGRGTMLSQIEGKPVKEFREVDSLIPHLLSRDNVKEAGDSIPLDVIVYDLPYRQSVTVSKIIKIKKEEK